MVDQSSKTKRPWSAQSWLGHLNRVPSFQSSEITADCRASWRNGRGRGSGDCWEPVLCRHDRAIVAGTHSSCNCGHTTTPNPASQDSINSDGVLTKSYLSLRSYFNWWLGEVSFFYRDVDPERPPLLHWMAYTCLRMHQQHWVGSVVYLFFFKSTWSLERNRRVWENWGGGSSEFDQSTRYACLELSNNKLKTKKHELRAVAIAAVVWGTLRWQERPQGCQQKLGNQGGPACGSERRAIWDFL